MDSFILFVMGELGDPAAGALGGGEFPQLGRRRPDDRRTGWWLGRRRLAETDSAREKAASMASMDSWSVGSQSQSGIDENDADFPLESISTSSSYWAKAKSRSFGGRSGGK